MDNSERMRNEQAKSNHDYTQTIKDYLLDNHIYACHAWRDSVVGCLANSTIWHRFFNNTESW